MSRHTDAPFAWGLPVSVAALATLVVGAPLLFYGLHLDHRPIVGPAAQRQLASGPNSAPCPLVPALCPSSSGNTGGQGALPAPFPGLGQAPGLLGLAPRATGQQGTATPAPGASVPGGGVIGGAAAGTTGGGNGGNGGNTGGGDGGDGGATGGTGDGGGGGTSGGSTTSGGATGGGSASGSTGQGPAPVSNADVAANVHVSYGSSGGGYNATVTLTNTGRTTANGWLLTFSANNGTVTSMSGAYVRLNNSTMIATNTVDNSALASGASVTFTYTASGSPGSPSNCTFNGVNCTLG